MQQVGSPAPDTTLLLRLGLDLAGTPVFLLGDGGLIWHVNAAAHAMMARHGMLTFADGHLTTRRRSERSALASAIDTVERSRTATSPGEPAILKFRDRVGCVVMALLIAPLAAPGLPPLLLVRVADLAAAAATDPAWLSHIFDLTRAEARVAGALLDGLDLAEISARDTTALETVRGHVKRAMAKVGVKSRSQLVRVLAQGCGALAPPTGPAWPNGVARDPWRVAGQVQPDNKPN